MTVCEPQRRAAKNELRREKTVRDHPLHPTGPHTFGQDLLGDSGYTALPNFDSLLHPDYNAVLAQVGVVSKNSPHSDRPYALDSCGLRLSFGYVVWACPLPIISKGEHQTRPNESPQRT